MAEASSSRLRQRLREARDPASPWSAALWFGLLGPPLAWGAHLLLGDLLYELGCGTGMRRREVLGLSLDTWAVLQTAVAAVVAGAAGLVALRAWRRLRRRGEGHASVDRAITFAAAGAVGSVLYLLLILYGFLPSVIFAGPCETSL